MPVKRREAKIRSDRITPEAIEAFSRAIKLEAAGKHQEKGEHGIHMSEPYRQAAMDLYFAIGQKPWEDSPLDVDDRGAAPEWCNGDRKEYWEKAQKLRRELMEAVK